LNVAGFVLAAGQFSIAKNKASGSGLANADALAVTFANLQVFAGVGAGFNAGATPADYSDDTIDTSNATGLLATASSLKLALVTTLTAKYTGLEITNLNGSLVGIDAITLGVSGVDVVVNQATAGSLLNWTLVTGAGIPSFTSAL